MTKYLIEDSITKMGLSSFEAYLDEAVALGYDYLKTCTLCNNWKLCTYVEIFPEIEHFLIKLVGISITIPRESELNNRVLSLLNFSMSIVSEGDYVTFYIPSRYALGLFYTLCKDIKPVWEEWRFPDAEEVEYLLGER